MVRVFATLVLGGLFASMSLTATGQAADRAPEASEKEAPQKQASESAPSGRAVGDIMATVCVSCHDRDLATTPRPSADWSPTLDRMVAYGARLNPAERESLKTYLIESHSEH